MQNLFCSPFLSLTNVLLYFKKKNAILLHMYVYIIQTHTLRLTCTVLVAAGWTILVCVGEASRTVWGACTTYTDTNTTHTQMVRYHFLISQQQMLEKRNCTIKKTNCWNWVFQKLLKLDENLNSVINNCS